MTTPLILTGDSATAASSPVAPPLTFRHDETGPVFPVGGAVLLLALLGVAAWTWWATRRRRSGAAGRFGLATWALASGPAGGNGSIRVVESARLDGVTRLHVVEWRQRRYLLATSGTSAPQVLDRDDSVEPPVTSAP